MFRLGVSKLDASIRTLSFIQIQNRFKNQALPIPKYLQNQVKMYSSAEDCMKNNSFVFKQSFVNGEWLDSVRNETFSVLNPSSGKELIQVTDCSEEDVAKAIAEAYSTFKSWRLTSAKERSAILRKWASLMKENSEDLAAIITMEQGKPINEARGEIGYASGFLEFFADAVRLIQGEIISSPDPKKKIFVEKEPCGVAALITPWNFPTAMITRKAGAALAAGCTVVIKPAPDTPLSALALCELAEKAGVPKGVFNVLPTSLKNTPAVGKLLCSSPLVAKVSFTGSTAVGKLLLRQSADSVKKISLELGGNAPFIVFESPT